MIFTQILDAILECVSRGIELFEGNFPFACAEMGQALTFLQEATAPQQQRPPFAISLRDAQFAKDKQALVPGCCCHACANYSRAYIHHLYNAHEMLGEICLTIHNLHHYLLFFKRMRQAIAQNQFDTFKMQI